MEFFNDYIMFRLFFDDTRVVPASRKRWTPPPAALTAGSNHASRRESVSDLRRAGSQASGWRVSCWDVSQQLRLPIRQRLMRKRSGSWSGPPSGSSSHHLLAIEEEDRPTSPLGKPLNRSVAQLANSERKWASLDAPTIQVTKVEKEDGPAGQVALQESAMAKSPEPPIMTAGLSAVLRIKEKLNRKRSGSLPEDRMNVPELIKACTIPPNSLSISPTHQSASASSPASPAHKRMVRRSTGGSLPCTASPSPRSLIPTSNNSALTLSPIPSPACSPLPSPGMAGPPNKFPPLLARSAENVTSVSTTKKVSNAERRRTLADLISGNAKQASRCTPSSISSLLDLYLESKKGTVEGDFYESLDDDDQIILDLGYEYKTKNRYTRRHVSSTHDPPTANLIHFSGSSSEADGEGRLVPITIDEAVQTAEIGQESRCEGSMSQSMINQDEPPKYKEVFDKIVGRRPLGPTLTAMALKFKTLGRKGAPKRGTTLPESRNPLMNELDDESWLRKASAPLPSRRHERTSVDRQGAAVKEEERFYSAKKLSEQLSKRKQSTTHYVKKKSRDSQVTLIQHKIHPLAIHKPQAPSQVARILATLDRKWSDPPGGCLAPELPERSQSNVSDTSTPRRGRKGQKENKERMFADPWTAEKSKSARCLQTAKLSKVQQQGEISVTLQYSEAIGFLIVTINKAKDLPWIKDAYVRIIRFEGDTLVETTNTSTVKGKSSPEFKQAYMFGMERQKLLITHLVIELWECDCVEKHRRFGYVVIGPHAGGTGCLQWTKMCKYPNFPARIWHQFALAED